MSFAELELSENLLRAVREEGYEIATPIQREAIPPILAGRDLLGCAQTGTGKTAAFALPTLQRLLIGGQPARERGRPIRTLVLAPTRELAAQIGESFRGYGRFTGLKHTVIFGGVGQMPQVRAIQHGVDVLVATPGRLLDLMNQGFVRLDRVEILILDEADQMLDMGFIHDLRRIVARVPRQRQTLLFSATMPDEIRRLADQWLADPVEVRVAPQATPAERVAQSVIFVEKQAKPQLLARYLKDESVTRTLVFTRTKHGADKLVRALTQHGFRAAAIHGNKSQSVRQQVLAQFKSQHPPVLVATDIAARGLDIDGVSHVVNYDLPLTPEIYVHRIGRTGRAGADGIAITLCAGDERGMLREIERLTRQRLPIAGGSRPRLRAGQAAHELDVAHGAGGQATALAGPCPTRSVGLPKSRPAPSGRGGRRGRSRPSGSGRFQGHR
ncbi:MAG: DEAD/DEAH box helicase [Planctomycetaceae bacterium]|nr:DEAD/DEAH box helicase [Planctomycetaceae bacterium]